MLLYKTIGLCVKPTNDDLSYQLERITALLKSLGCDVLYEERAADYLKTTNFCSREELGERCDLIIVLGGDGTMLSVARSLSRFGKPVVGVNAGRLGFITDLCQEDVDTRLPEMLAGQSICDERPLLEGIVLRNGKEIYRQLAVNDIGISHGRAGGMVDFLVYVNNQQMACQSADGIICSTATGSTAYSLAAGGPILHPLLEGMILVPVAPHTLSNRPIVLPLKSQIQIELLDARDAVAYFDMQEFCDMVPGDRLIIRQAEHRVKILHPIGYDYFKLLRQKLKWNFMPKAG